MCGCTSNFVEEKHDKANSSLGVRYSNLSTSAAEQQCLEYMDAHPTAYDGNMSKCITAKKNESAQQVVGYVGQTGTFLSNLANIFGAAINPGAPAPGSPLPPSLDEPKGLSVFAWVGIALGAATAVTIIILVVRKNKKGAPSNGK